MPTMSALDAQNWLTYGEQKPDAFVAAHSVQTFGYKCGIQQSIPDGPHAHVLADYAVACNFSHMSGK